VLAVDAGSAGSGLPVDDDRLVFRRVDLAHHRQVHDLLFGPARALGIDAVVHRPLDARAADGGARSHALNVDATRELVLGCEQHPTIRRVVYLGSGAVYALRGTAPSLLDEDQPLEFDPGASQWVRDRVEADLTVSSRPASPRLAILVLRCAEVLAPGVGSQLWDYLQSRICLRPLGFDPMINLLSLSDCTRAIALALAAPAPGIYNVPGADTLPLSRVASRFGRIDVPVPGPLLAPLYRLRTRAIGLEFRYDLNMRRFHFGGILDGARARAKLGYQPCYPIRWPAAAWCSASNGETHSRAPRSTIARSSAP
jgi:UDP-glucose 4-epimerase